MKTPVLAISLALAGVAGAQTIDIGRIETAPAAAHDNARMASTRGATGHVLNPVMTRAVAHRLADGSTEVRCDVEPNPAAPANRRDTRASLEDSVK